MASPMWKDGDGFSLSLDPSGDGYDTHGIALTEPLPPPMQEIMSFLQKHYAEVNGVVLVVGPEGTRRDYDASLAD